MNVNKMKSFDEIKKSEMLMEREAMKKAHYGDESRRAGSAVKTIEVRTLSVNVHEPCHTKQVLPSMLLPYHKKAWLAIAQLVMRTNIWGNPLSLPPPPLTFDL